MDLTKDEAQAILSIAKKIIVALEKNNNKIVRSTEDRLDHDDVVIDDVGQVYNPIDLTGVRAPENVKNVTIRVVYYHRQNCPLMKIHVWLATKTRHNLVDMSSYLCINNLKSDYNISGRFKRKANMDKKKKKCL